MQATAPDLIRAVIGFRQWRLHGDELWSLHADDRWGRGLQTARCLGEHAHDGPAPQNGCTCGFYAWYAPTPRTASVGTSELVGGAVALWGQVELHAHGIRAQHAMIVALALPMSSGRQAPAPGRRGQRARGPGRARAQAQGDRARARRRHPAAHAPARHDAQQARRAGPRPPRPGSPALLRRVADGLPRRRLRLGSSLPGRVPGRPPRRAHARARRRPVGVARRGRAGRARPRRPARGRRRGARRGRHLRPGRRDRSAASARSCCWPATSTPSRRRATARAGATPTRSTASAPPT